MGKEIVTRATIHAPPHVVWQVLCDFEHWKEWNPFIVSMEGKREVGETLTAKFSNGFAMKPKLLVLQSDKELRWKGKLAWGGLFDGEHRFVLRGVEINGASCTELEHGEQFSGVLIPLLGSMLRETQANFIKMNEALEQRCQVVLNQ